MLWTWVYKYLFETLTFSSLGIHPEVELFDHQFNSVQFSRSVMSNSLRPLELQHARPPCPSPTPGVYSNSCRSSRWRHPAISHKVVLFRFFQKPPQSLPQWLYQFMFSSTGHKGSDFSTSLPACCCSVLTVSRVWLFDPVGCSLPGSYVHEIFQARILEWVSIFYSRGSSRPRDWTCISCISCIGMQILYHYATWEVTSTWCFLGFTCFVPDSSHPYSFDLDCPSD